MNKHEEAQQNWNTLKRGFVLFECSKCNCGQTTTVISEDRNGNTRQFCKDCFPVECRAMGVEKPILVPLCPY